MPFLGPLPLSQRRKGPPRHLRRQLDLRQRRQRYRGRQQSGGGLVTVIVRGDVGAVKAAVESIKSHYSVIYEDGSTSADLTKNETLIKEAFFSAVSAIENYSKSSNIPKRELACTLIVVFIHKKTVSTGQVGDGAVTGEYLSGDIAVISKPAESEYINEVTPITAEKWISKLNINSGLMNIKKITAFTDGCQRAVLVKENSSYVPFIPATQ